MKNYFKFLSSAALIYSVEAMKTGLYLAIFGEKDWKTSHIFLPHFGYYFKNIQKENASPFKFTSYILTKTIGDFGRMFLANELEDFSCKMTAAASLSLLTDSIINTMTIFSAKNSSACFKDSISQMFFDGLANAIETAGISYIYNGCEKNQEINIE